MAIKISNLALAPDTDPYDKKQLANLLRLSPEQICSVHIMKRSIDARHKPQIRVVYTLLVHLDGAEQKVAERLQSPQISYLSPSPSLPLVSGTRPLPSRPVVVGTGPAGLFCAYLLAQQGYRPIVLERGEPVEQRSRSVQSFWESGKLNPRSNVQFGEGGAGTFSDGKLTTRIHDPLCRDVLDTFRRHGAPEEILYEAKPHIGTDILKTVVKNMRNAILSWGGEVHFEHQLTDIHTDSGGLDGISVNGQPHPCRLLVLAIGHSARDTFHMLLERGAAMQAKAFAIGARIEHPQELINAAQYGDAALAKLLKNATYHLTYHQGDRACYSFCMCPGGSVVASASEEGMLVTNGMSEYARDRENANSALVVSVTPEDFPSASPLAGIAFQQQWERLAFQAGGGNYRAPVQRVEDFLQKKPSADLGRVAPSYLPGVTPAGLDTCLPPYVTESMRGALRSFDRKLKGFALPDALLTGVETRTSSPVRLLRGEDFQAVGIPGIYPAGEGSGYAGGIVSAAVDGLKIARKIIATYATKD
ncbi:MAG: NAD(P)-binding protein [Clostridia bacterium]|nr:NAD(P)-binding protein [Clostridia bacterium]